MISKHFWMSLTHAETYESLVPSSGTGSDSCSASRRGSSLTPADAGNDSQLTKVGVFEDGTRYEAGPYHVVVLSGTYREMGRQYGALMTDELNSEYEMLRSRFTANGYTETEVYESARETTSLQAKRIKEIRAGIAETSGLTPEAVDILYVFYVVMPVSLGFSGEKTGCSFLAAWDNYTTDGSVVLSRNWDLNEEFLAFKPYYTLAVYNPTDGSNGVATFGPAGGLPETLMNSAGLFIAEDNGGSSGSSLEVAGRPMIVGEFFRMMLDYSTIEELDAVIMSTLTNSAFIVNAAGPDMVYSYEESIWDIKRREGEGVIAAANHFVDPSWRLDTTGIDNSVTRYNNLLNLAEENKGSIDAERMMAIRDVLYEDGGATFEHYTVELNGMTGTGSTVYRVVYVPETRTFCMKVIDEDWQQVELAPLFSV
ncbi:C45 family autoproteolytic acyltransferase/hydolase [Methanoplanus endosymbiosus]|uniref:C45 family peptidase n=1 Tax=Methanoplanus endosymbiosus TaxID=33865 RepID=A0A9E7PSN5_9EURY|nr:C45 family peptidase [Methanoplanus endosymbiosus]UUX93022.1 C45 family peptidase [Methanoplanus endosymbiosus]